LKKIIIKGVIIKKNIAMNRMNEIYHDAQNTKTLHALAHAATEALRFEEGLDATEVLDIDADGPPDGFNEDEERLRVEDQERCREEGIHRLLKAQFGEITDPIGMMCELASNPQHLIRYPCVFQEILDEVDPSEFLPLQNYLQTVLFKMRRLENITEQAVCRIILSSDTEASSRKRKRTTSPRSIEDLDKTDMLHLMRARPPMHSDDDPYTVKEMKAMSREDTMAHILAVYPQEFQ
jgi:hypothetical protein